MTTRFGVGLLALAILAGACGHGAKAPTTLTVVQVNFRFEPANLTLARGGVVSVKDDAPVTPHTFTVKGTDIDVRNDAGDIGTALIDLPPGTYTFICRYHVSQGMKGTLIVR
ncbi:MAG TPA: cupredoxin domain-containing protein [Actinomycetota bacterium]